MHCFGNIHFCFAYFYSSQYIEELYLIIIYTLWLICLAYIINSVLQKLQRKLNGKYTLIFCSLKMTFTFFDAISPLKYISEKSGIKNRL